MSTIKYDREPGRRPPGRPRKQLPAGFGDDAANQPTQTLASMLGAAANETIADQRAGQGPGEWVGGGERGETQEWLPSEEPQPEIEPTDGSPGMRTPLHEPSPAAMAAGFGGASADEAAEPVPAGGRFRRQSLGQRVPFGIREQRMAFPPIPGFHLHWFNDEPGRIRRAEMAGYSYVDQGDGRKVTTVVGTDRSGKPMQAFLMKIRTEWFVEDMRAREAEQMAILGAIQKGKFNAPENSYSPGSGIKMSSGVERR